MWRTSHVKNQTRARIETLANYLLIREADGSLYRSKQNQITPSLCVISSLVFFIRPSIESVFFLHSHSKNHVTVFAGSNSHTIPLRLSRSSPIPIEHIILLGFYGDRLSIYFDLRGHSWWWQDWILNTGPLGVNLVAGSIDFRFDIAVLWA